MGLYGFGYNGMSLYIVVCLQGFGYNGMSTMVWV